MSHRDFEVLMSSPEIDEHLFLELESVKQMRTRDQQHGLKPSSRRPGMQNREQQDSARNEASGEIRQEADVQTAAEDKRGGSRRRRWMPSDFFSFGRDG